MHLASVPSASLRTPIDFLGLGMSPDVPLFSDSPFDRINSGCLVTLQSQREVYADVIHTQFLQTLLYRSSVLRKATPLLFIRAQRRSFVSELYPSVSGEKRKKMSLRCLG